MLFDLHLKAITLGLSAVLAGCNTVPVADEASVFETLNLPVERVQQAAVDALAVNGFDLKKSEPEYVEGARPHKMGFFVGSGGETAGIWLIALPGNKTEVRIDTEKSMLGIVGQKNWDDELWEAIRESLSQWLPAQESSSP